MSYESIDKTKQEVGSIRLGRPLVIMRGLDCRGGGSPCRMLNLNNVHDSRLCGLIPLVSFIRIHIVSHFVFYAFMSISYH